jgi:hypothetical protein
MILSVNDFQPENLYRAHEELVRNLLPQAWWSRMIPREITAWAHLFAVGGMAEYDESLAFEFSKGAERGPCVGTFIHKEGACYFFGSDERGVWTHKLEPDCRWQASRNCATLLRTCCGPVNSRAINWYARVSALADTIAVQAARSHAFRALLSLGRLYYP